MMATEHQRTTAQTVVSPPVVRWILQIGVEACDDANEIEDDGCLSDCTLAPVATCGNGEVQEGEQCDDGNRSNPR